MKYDVDALLEILKKLRSPDGCPWDRVQTHESIKNCLIEEAYEVAEAVEEQKPMKLADELGDVLLQVAFHATLGAEAGEFTMEDVCRLVCEKMIRRHPHVFGDVLVNNTDDVLKNWDSIKKETKGQESYTDTLKSVAKSLPALMRAQKVGKRAMRAGMDFKCKEDAISCIDAERSEFDEAVASGDKERIAEELGDLIFSCVNAARHLGIDAEQALTDSTDKFIRRFSKTEELVSLDLLNMPDLDIEQLDVYWERAKKLL